MVCRNRNRAAAIFLATIFCLFLLQFPGPDNICLSDDSSGEVKQVTPDFSYPNESVHMTTDVNDTSNGYSINMSVKRVMLDVTVRDRKGRYKDDLTQDDFEVYENGVQQEIDFFSPQADKPVSIVFLLDVSGSMGVGEKFDLAKDALQFMVRTTKSRDEFAVYLFADEGFETLAGFRRSKVDLFTRLDEVKAYGKSAILDALSLTPNFILGAKNPRQMVIVLSDGVDNYSKTTLEIALEQMRRLKAPLHSFAIKNLPGRYYPKDEFYADLLSQCSLESGGEFFQVSDAQAFREACAKLQKAMRSSYLIGYKSNNRVNDGKYRQIRVAMDKKKLIAYYRKGYYP